MNMNLWKKIGIDHHEGSDFDDQEVFSSIKKSDTAHNNRSLAQNAANIRCNNSTYRSENVSIVKEKPSRIRIPNDFDLQFESCESEPLNSDRPSSPNLPTAHQTHGQTKQKIKSLQLEILFLQSEHNSFQTTLRKDLDFFTNFIQRYFRTLLQTLPRLTTSPSTSTASQETQTNLGCSCETHKKMIDGLTKQFWELQQQLEGKEEENRRLREQLAICSVSPIDPLKKIQYGLLQERSECIKKLKQEQEILIEENSQLSELLQDRQRQMQQIEAAHEAALLQLRSEIDQIRESNYVCNEKVGAAMDEKYSIEDDLAALQNKYNSLERHYENHRRDTQSNNGIIKIQDMTRSYARERYNPEEKSVSSNHYSDQSREILPSPKTQHPKPFHRLDCVSNNKYVPLPRAQTTKADYISFLYQQDFGGCVQSRLKEKEKWHKITTEFAQNNYKKPAENYLAKARIANGLSYERALTNLSEIQRDVRKEINRSKEACR